jgi:hypothetical protein
VLRESNGIMTQTKSTRPRGRRSCIVGIGISLVVFLSAMDVHGHALNCATHKTPTPVLRGYELGADHIEPGSSSLAPAHGPMLLTKVKQHVVLLRLNRPLTPPTATAFDTPDQQADVPLELFQQPSPARAPPGA